jgi:hypothetical protein
MVLPVQMVDGWITPGHGSRGGGVIISAVMDDWTRMRLAGSPPPSPSGARQGHDYLHTDGWTVHSSSDISGMLLPGVWCYTAMSDRSRPERQKQRRAARCQESFVSS